MSFRLHSLVILMVFTSQSLCDRVDGHDKDKQMNRTLFVFDDVKHCANSDYYDLNYFACVPCRTLGERMQPSLDKFTCTCKLTSLSPATAAVIYDSANPRRTCTNICNRTHRNDTQANVTILAPHYCTKEEVSLPEHNCKFKYINRTRVAPLGVEHFKSVEVTHLNWQYDGLCDKCDLEYNFEYQDYCIANVLLRPYLGFNSFWQATIQHFGQLKFVAFFCLTLNNNTACNQLANLCVLSFYSFDKNSPCSIFLLSQASDVVFRYGSLDEQVSHRQIRPFLFYRKGKDMVKDLTDPIRDLTYTLDDDSIKIFGVTYALDGSLKRWGHLNLYDLNLCPRSHKYTAEDVGFIKFAKKYDVIECSMRLEHILDLAMLYGNERFMTLYLKLTKDIKGKMLLMSIPILIEDITLENKRPQKEDWQLVKRFQMIEFRAKRGSKATTSSPAYEDVHKLLLYRSLRYVERIEFHYDIHDHNQISIPLVKLRYRHIEFTSNTTLGMPLNFQFIITNDRIGQSTRGEGVNEMALPLLLLLTLVVALVRANNTRIRRGTASNGNRSEDFCHCAFFTEFLMHLISYMALAFLVCFLLHVYINALTYLTQGTVQLSLPIVRDYRPLELMVYAALMLKLTFVCISFWRLCHFNIFFIDWERPRCGDSNHFNLKNNLETSSVCSSVRTYTSDANVSAWRSILLANEWIRLSGKQKTSIRLQGLVTYVLFKFLNDTRHTVQEDLTLKIFFISLAYISTYICQYVVKCLIMTRICGNPLQTFIEHCSLANISVFALVEPSYGYYIHGRSPHGFADSDMATMIMQLQRETQSMCGRRGLLSDSDQCYTIMPPKKLSNYFNKLLLPYQRSFGAGLGGQRSQHKEINNLEGSLEKTSIAYTSVNRFFCAFIDHGIKDIDYIIKEKTLLEQLLQCEFDNYLTDHRGIFYIDNGWPFSQMFLYGNEMNLFVLHFLLLLAVFTLSQSLLAAVLTMCILNKVLQSLFVGAIKENMSTKTLIDKRFFP